MTDILLVVISAFIGYIFSVWQGRSRPWITLLGFDGETYQITDEVEVPKALSDLTETVGTTHFLPSGKTTMNAVLNTYQPVKDWLEMNSTSLEVLDEGIIELQSASNTDELKKTLWKLLNPPGLGNALIYSLASKEIIPVEFDTQKEPQIPYAITEQERDGCFMFDFLFGQMYFGSHLNTVPFRAEKLKPMVELISRLEKEKLLEVYKSLKEIFAKQLKSSGDIFRQAEEIIKAYSRWTVYFDITNFGASPFLVFTDSAELHVKGKQIQPFNVRCQMLRLSGEEETFEPVKGAICIKSGTTENLAMVTKHAQTEIQGGGILRSAFESGETNAFIRLITLGNQIPFKMKIKSTELRFAGES